MSEDGKIWSSYHDFHFFCDTGRFQKLLARTELIRMVADLPGDVLDAGAFKGISTIQFAQAVEAFSPRSLSKVIACDTFEAEFPHSLPSERAAIGKLAEAHDPYALENLIQSLNRIGLSHRVDILQGDIVKKLPEFINAQPGLRFRLLHCDLDSYEPTLAVLKAAWPRLVSGGIAVFDEYAIRNWGEANAVDEFFATLPNKPRLCTLPLCATPTAYCVKL